VTFTAFKTSGDEVPASYIQALITEVRGVSARKVLDETVNNSSTLQDDNELFVALTANNTYVFSLTLSYISGTTPDFKFKFNIPAGASMAYGVMGLDTAGGFTTAGNLNSGNTPSIGGSAGDAMAICKGTVIVSSTAGNLSLQWAQNVANVSDTIVRAGSILEARLQI
jgi:hypothetical protein